MELFQFKQFPISSLLPFDLAGPLLIVGSQLLGSWLGRIILVGEAVGVSH